MKVIAVRCGGNGSTMMVHHIISEISRQPDSKRRQLMSLDDEMMLMVTVSLEGVDGRGEG